MEGKVDKLTIIIFIGVLCGFIGMLIAGPYAWIAFWPCTLAGMAIGAKLVGEI